MDNFISIIADTPIPTILVIGGLFFLFLAVGGQFGAHLITERVKERPASFIGVLLLVCGLSLYSFRPSAMEVDATPSDGDIQAVEAQLREVERAIQGNEEEQHSVQQDIVRLEQ